MANNPGNPLHQPGYLLKERYRIRYFVGNGAYGRTYKAIDEQDPNKRECAVKQFSLSPLLAHSDQSLLEEAQHRFEKEAEKLSQLKHPQIPELFDYFEENQQVYLVQTYINDENLQKEIKSSQPWRETDVIFLLQDVLEVLSFIHDKKIIHRDIKPSNLIRRHDGKIIVIDFGSIKEITTLSLDRQGRFSTKCAGTPAYIPPEQNVGNPRRSSDIYALGITAIEALIGTCPEEHELTEKYTWRNRAKVSRKLAKILNKMVHKDLRERYQSASEVLADLNPQTRRINWRIWLGLAAATIVIILIGKIIAIFRSVSLYKEGNDFVKLNQHEAAIALYNQAIELNPNFPEALTNRGYSFIKRNNYQDGLNSCKAAIKIRSDDSNSWNCKGVASERLGNNEEAITAYQEAIKLDPNFPEPRNNKGEVLLKEQKPDEALTAFNEAIRLKPDYRLAWTNKGTVLHQLRNYEEAVNAFKEAIKIDNNYSAWIGLGNALRQLENRDLEALDAYEKAIKIDPTIFDAWFAKGAVLENLKRQQEALVAYEKAAELRPDYAPLKEKIQQLK